MSVIPVLRRLRQENCLNPGGGGCGELRSRHCTPAWVTRGKLHLKKKKKKKWGKCAVTKSREVHFKKQNVARSLTIVEMVQHEN